VLHHLRRAYVDPFTGKADWVLVAQPDKRIGAGHGSFDNDVDVVARTLGRIVGAPLVAPPDDLRGF